MCDIQHKVHDSSLWHKRLGHAPLKFLAHIDGLQHVKSDNQLYPICSLAKQSRLPFLSSTTRSKSMFDLVHADVWGPYRVPTFDGKRYF